MFYCEECNCLYYQEDLVEPKKKLTVFSYMVCPVHYTRPRNFKIDYRLPDIRRRVEELSTLRTLKSINKKVKLYVVDFNKLTPSEILKVKEIYNM